jgi:hypothetical protein
VPCGTRTLDCAPRGDPVGVAAAVPDEVQALARREDLARRVSLRGQDTSPPVYLAPGLLAHEARQHLAHEHVLLLPQPIRALALVSERVVRREPKPEPGRGREPARVPGAQFVLRERGVRADEELGVRVRELARGEPAAQGREERGRRVRERGARERAQARVARLRVRVHGAHERAAVRAARGLGAHAQQAQAQPPLGDPHLEPAQREPARARARGGGGVGERGRELRLERGDEPVERAELRGEVVRERLRGRARGRGAVRVRAREGGDAPVEVADLGEPVHERARGRGDRVSLTGILS